MKRKTIMFFGKTADHSLDFLLNTFDDARATTLNRVLGISNEELHWQFAKGWNSVNLSSTNNNTSMYN